MEAKDSTSIKTTAPEGWIKSDTCPAILSFEDYCLLDQSTQSCGTPSSSTWSGALSVVSFFYGAGLVDANGEWQCTELSQASVDATAAYLVDQMNSPAGQVMYGFFMGKGTVNDGFTSVTRSGIAVAGPLCVAKGGIAGAGQCFDSLSDGLDVTSDQALSYMNNLIGPWILDSVAEKYNLEDGFLSPLFYQDIKAGTMEVRTFSFMLLNWESFRLLTTDSSIVVFSLAFVYFWLFMHIQSFFIASVSISQIFLSIPASIFPYAFFFGIKYFGLMQVRDLVA